MSGLSPFDFLGSINEKKEYLFTDCSSDTSGEAAQLDSVDRQYPPFMVNRGLSYFVDTVMLANEMNANFNLSKKMQYDFLYYGIRKNRRFSKWHKKQKDTKDIELIKEAFSYNRERAEEVYDLIDIKQLRKYMDKGGMKKT